MDLERTKELIMTYVKQFDTDAAIGLPVDRTKRTLLRRLHRTKDAKPAYDSLIEDRSIHESGNGCKASPLIVVLGSAESKPVTVPQPWSFIDQQTLTGFILKMVDTYEFRGWGTLDIKSEIIKALESYNPSRPY